LVQAFANGGSLSAHDLFVVPATDNDTELYYAKSFRHVAQAYLSSQSNSSATFSPTAHHPSRSTEKPMVWFPPMNDGSSKRTLDLSRKAYSLNLGAAGYDDIRQTDSITKAVPGRLPTPSPVSNFRPIWNSV